MSPRKYEQRKRAVDADNTRRRILDAVQDRLRRAPTDPISVDAVAKIAGVTRPSVYAIFGSKAGLFEAVGGDVLERGGFSNFLDHAAHTDALDGLRAGILGILQMYSADREVLRTLYSMAQLDAATFAGSVAQVESGRIECMDMIAHNFHERGLLAPGVSIDDATNLLWLVTSFVNFDLLCNDREMTVEAAAALLTRTAENTLLSPIDSVTASSRVSS